MNVESAMLQPSPEKPKGKSKRKNPENGVTIIKAGVPDLMEREGKRRQAEAKVKAGMKKLKSELKNVEAKRQPFGPGEVQKELADLREIEQRRVAEEEAEKAETIELSEADIEIVDEAAERRKAEEAEWEAKIAGAKEKIIEEEKAVPGKAEMKPDERDMKAAIVRVPDERARKKAEAAEVAKLRRELKEMKPPKPFEKMSAKERMKLTPEELLAMAEESKPEAEKPAPPTSERFTEQETEFFGEGEKLGKRFEKVERRPQEIMTARPLEVEMRLDEIKDMEIPDFDYQAYENLVRRQQTIDRELADDKLGKIKLGWWKKAKKQWELGGIGRKIEKFDQEIEKEEAARASGRLTPAKIRRMTKGKSEGDGHMPMPGAPRDRM